MLRLEGITYRYPGERRDVLHGISLELAKGTVTGLAGPAEAGKSTLCLVAGGLAPRVVGGTLGGKVELEREDVRRWPMHRLAERVATVLQDPSGQLSLIADSVFAEVAFGPANLGRPRTTVIEDTQWALEQVGIADLAERDPTRLSGGQLQLVAIASLLAMRPDVLILDEPVAHLDARASGAVLDAIRAIADGGAAVLLAEQRSAALAAVCDHLAVIAHGNIVVDGPTSEVLADPGVAALGVAELPAQRLRRLALAAGLDPARSELPT